MNQAKEHGFKLMQFNAVVENNVHARHLYERLGFVMLGTIPNGFDERRNLSEYLSVLLCTVTTSEFVQLIKPQTVRKICI